MGGGVTDRVGEAEAGRAGTDVRRGGEGWDGEGEAVRLGR